jgi:hypothetical protein
MRKNSKKNEGIQVVLRKVPPFEKVGDTYYFRRVRLTHVQACIILVLFYNGSEEEGRENFKEFYDLSKSRIELRLEKIDPGPW